MRWFAVGLLIGRADGDVEMTVDVKAATPAAAISRAIELACASEHVSPHRVCVERCKYNDMRPMLLRGG